MAAPGSGLFDDALAAQVRRDFEAALAAGQSAYAATQTVLERHDAAIHAPSEERVVMLALAALLADQGIVVPRVRKRALTIINHREGQEAWEVGGALGSARSAVLQELREKLIAFP